MKKIAVSVCMGSSCYLRGNRELTEALENLITQNNWQNYIEFVGNLCEDDCKCGPNVRINDTLISKATLEKVKNEIARHLTSEE
jgi:iron-hydrogenase subunit alpha